MGLDERDGDLVKVFLERCSKFRFDLNPKNSGYHTTTPCVVIRLLSPTIEYLDYWPISTVIHQTSVNGMFEIIRLPQSVVSTLR